MTGPSVPRVSRLTAEALSPLVIATHNPGKLAEMRTLLATLSIAVSSAAERGLAEPEETADSFAGNAIIKAEAACERTGNAAIADDSGLVVDALDGAPGIHSARWAGPEKDFAAAIARVLAGVEGRDRSAAFVAVLALAIPGERTRTFEGRVDGTIADAPRGTGFGYDPIFVPGEGDGRTFGEMSAEEKAGPAERPLSHRARALTLFRAAVEPS